MSGRTYVVRCDLRSGANAEEPKKFASIKLARAQAKAWADLGFIAPIYRVVCADYAQLLETWQRRKITSYRVLSPQFAAEREKKRRKHAR